MIAPVHIPYLPDGTHEVVRRFAFALAGVIEAMGRAFNANPKPPVPPLLLWGYLLRLRGRLVRLWPRLLNGVPSRPPGPARARRTAPPATPRLRLPRRKGWLAHEIGWFGRGYASNIQHVLSEPETAALIAADPRAQRLLRPLCRILGLDIPAIPPLPPRPRAPRSRKPAPAPARPPRLTRKQREAILWYPNSEGKPMKLLPRRLPRDGAG